MLYLLKQSLQFQVEIMLPNFALISYAYYARVLSYIYQYTIFQNLLTLSQKKNKLSKFKLKLFFTKIIEHKQSVLNQKQHYIAQVLAYITTTYLRLFTISARYKKRALLSSTISKSLLRCAELYTLRQSNIAFCKIS